MQVKKLMIKRGFLFAVLLLLFFSCTGFTSLISSKPGGKIQKHRIEDDLILLPSGSYKDTTGKVQHVQSFYLASYEVTQVEWKNIMKVNPAEFNGTGLYQAFPGEDQDKRPVEMISWFQAVEFCNEKSIEEGLTPVYNISGSAKQKTAERDFLANGYRLPTAAEWEYAALSAGQNTFTFAGTNASEGTLGLNAYAWFKVNADFATHEVGLKLPNMSGFYDMSGNVFEWCEDEGRLGPLSRIWKGGSALSEPEECAVFYTGEYWPETRNSFTGLRLARNAR